ncbi:glycosyl transferase family protein [Novosphingobium sp. ZN18A2]|uniref:glycosyl transferase family protein n=1 Tax=Novosphingobium sp. ZN18A2 TaxID=3079861 RepID=UPI0030CF6A47
MDAQIARAVMEGLVLVQHELLLFAAFWLALGTLDEMLVDVAWLGLALRGRAGARPLTRPPDAPLGGIAAVFVPAWQEANVVGAMLSHCLESWPQAELRIYAGCYRNDTPTLCAMMEAAGDPRLRIVVHDVDGPTTKADCLNRLYEALCDDEARAGFRARSIVLHDAEDLVHPAALSELDAALDQADFVQLPVMPEQQADSRWVAGHYADEFAEAHGKTMVVRDWLGVGLPSAGVGCAFSRDAIARIARRRGTPHPFAPDSLTEDYECGLLVAEDGGKGRFLRIRDAAGALVATREFFPATLDAAVRQKTRWLHGIAFQGWDRLGWHRRPAEVWMRMRDRRGPLTAVVLVAAYLLIVIWPFAMVAERSGMIAALPYSRALEWLLVFNLAGFFWRAIMRFAFTAHVHGWVEGVRSVLRIHVSNVIAIIVGRRALLAYLRTLRGTGIRWDKTVHRRHPAAVRFSG